MPAPRPISRQFALEIDGANVGTLKKFTGLGLTADILTSPSRAGVDEAKQVTNVAWTPGRATVGAGLGTGMYDWITASMEKGGDPRSGVFTTADANGKVTSSLTFKDAVITEVTVPRLDATSKDAAYFDVVFETTQVSWVAGTGETLLRQSKPKRKAWLTSNFRITVGDLPCLRVMAIESFTWRCTTVSDPGGGLVTRTVSVPDLVLTVSIADYAVWADAARKWFVDGNHRDGNEMKGRLVFLAPNLRDELGAIDMPRMGFRRFEHPESVADSEQLGRFVVTLYVEQMALSITELDA